MVLPATPTNAFLLIGDGIAIGVDVDNTCHLMFPCRTLEQEEDNNSNVKRWTRTQWKAGDHRRTSAGKELGLVSR
ncbi:hypothetical protein GUJ93_ZPchr0013g33884 [Zizania palustris]|uniref:Uncharacterized protein n=1 Tax=Zizania palustris TaxID=103762 RepID=A0A8J6BWM8_ZIZPA|nr:hypothetical protein GUJ93_ZPchr0013g33884 [Zizania palustris]